MIENVASVLEAVLNFIRVELKARISLFIERALQSMHDRQYISFSSRLQSRAAERWLNESRSTFETALHKRMGDAFLGRSAKFSADELKLLDDESLNVVMLRARLVSSVMEKARDHVVALEVRLEALRQAGVQINSRAFTPGAIADGFMDVLQQLNVPPEVQIVLMEAYSERGADMLYEFYKDLNDLLISHGVMPGFKYSVAKAAESKARSSGPAGGPSWPGQHGTGAGGGIGGGYGGPGGGGTGTDWIPAWPAVASGASLPAHFAQLVDAKLSAMQAAIAHLTAETWQPGTLRDTFALPPPISLSPEQEESIDHIEAVFLDLIRDTRISPRFRSELNRLILPLMSLRLTDAQLFKNPENPVRRFLRQLALLGFRDMETPIREFEHISLIVGRIVSERAQEIASFASGADALYTIAKNEVRLQLAARNLQRESLPQAEKDIAASRQKIKDAHNFVQAALREMSAGLKLPSVLKQFVLRLLGPWMMIRYQRYGEDSEQMRDCILSASTFFSLLEPSVGEENRKLKIEQRKKALEEIAIRTSRSKIPEGEMRIMLEAVAEYFDRLDSDPLAGLTREQNSGTFSNYLDELAEIRDDAAPVRATPPPQAETQASPLPPPDTTLH